MLQNNPQGAQKIPDLASGLPQQMQAASRSVSEFFSFTRGVVRRQFVVISLSAAVVLGICVVYLRVAPPTYTAKVQVLLANQRAQFVQEQSLLAEPALDLNQIETQLQILNSKSIAISVINQLDLTHDPDLDGSALSLSSLWRQARAWIFSTPKSQPANLPGQPSEDVLAAFQGRLTVARVSFSNVIEISYSSSSSARSADVANAIANAYITDQMDAKSQANHDASHWLQERLWDLGDQALTAERAVGSYKYQNNIVSSGGRPIDDQQISDLNNRLFAARAQTSDAAAKLDRYEAILQANSEDSTSLRNLDAANSDVLNSPIITSLRQKYLELSRYESEWSARLGPNHSAVIELRTKILSLRASIIDEVKRLAETSRNDLATAKQRQQEIEAQFADAVSRGHTTDTAELTIRGLESRAKGLRSLYDTFLQRYVSSVQQESFPIAETRVISLANPPLSKSKPKTMLVLILGLIGGIGTGLALGLLRDLMDRVFRTPAQITAALATPCLSLVPALRTPKTARQNQARDHLQPQTGLTFSGIHRTVVAQPWSRYAEAIRSIKLSIDISRTSASHQVIGITSAIPNEGKTTIALSLAQLIGHSGDKKVIVVDCDLRNPSLSKSLAPDAQYNFLDVINGTRSIEDATLHDPKTKLDLLPAATGRTPLHTSEILSSEATHKVFARLRETYDYIIVDLPPLAPLVDARAGALLIDCFVLVVEWGRTKIDVVRYALHTAPHVHESVIGVVLNKANVKAMGRYDSYWSDYYSDSYFAHYGFSETD